MTTTTPTQTERDWQTKRRKRLLVTSASQFETWELCPRKWWLKQVRGLKEPQSASKTFGTVVHDVCRRFLTADDLGRDPTTGQPVDLFPPGWHIAKSQFDGSVEGEINPAEQDLIRKLVHKAVEEGVLERRPDRVVEKRFDRTLTEQVCPTCNGQGKLDMGSFGPTPCQDCKGDGKGTHIKVMGFIDVLYPDGIEDHKSTKSMKWAKSKEALKKNTQVLLYAHELLCQLRDKGAPLPQYVNIRHNVFCKDYNDPKIRKTEVSVPVADIEAKHREIVEISNQMDTVRRRADTWSDLPDPVNRQRTCTAYGGCPFLTICAGQESEEGYENRVARHLTNQAGDVSLPLLTQSYTPKGPSTMNFADKLAQAREKMGVTSTTPAPLQQPAPVQQPLGPIITTYAQAPSQVAAPLPQQALAPVVVAAGAAPVSGLDMTQWPAWGVALPPWADLTVKNNGGIGFNAKGEPCRICATKAKAANRPTPDMFLIEPIGDGTIMWVGRDGTPAQGAEGRTPLRPDWTPETGAAVEAQVKVQQPPVAQPPLPVAAQAPPPAPVPTLTPVLSLPVAPAASTPPAAAAPLGMAARMIMAPAPIPDSHAAPVIEPGPLDLVSQSLKNADANEPTRQAGRPRKGFMLLINCSVTKGDQRKGSGRYVYDMSEVLREWGAELAKSVGAPDYYSLDPFKRRDAMARLAEKMADSFGTDIVMANGVGTGASDLKAIVDPLRAFAGTIVQADAL